MLQQVPNLRKAPSGDPWYIVLVVKERHVNGQNYLSTIVRQFGSGLEDIHTSAIFSVEFVKWLQLLSFF